VSRLITILQILAGIRTVKVAGAAAGEHVVSGLCHDISMPCLTNQVLGQKAKDTLL